MASQTKNPEEVVVVTGGAGFMGQHIVKHLIEQKEFPITEVRVFDDEPLKWHPGLAVNDNSDITLTQYQGDIRKLEDVQSAFRGASAVIHNTSIIDLSSLPDREKLYGINVYGTDNVIKACINNNIKMLIYTSSSAVEKEFGHYGRSKAKAENLILRANKQQLKNGTDQISTCALRLPAEYGEGYKGLVDLLQNGTIGKTLIRFGDDNSLSSMAYAGNLAWGFVCAVRKLRTPHASNPAGRAIKLADDTPQKTGCGHLEPFLTYFDVQWSSFAVPFWMLFIIASICEWISFLLQPFYTLRLDISKDLLQAMQCPTIYNQDEAKRFLDYQPLYSYDESLKRTITYFERCQKVK